MIGAASVGMAIAKRSDMARVHVAVAHKLAVILHRMWADSANSAGQADRCVRNGRPMS